MNITFTTEELAVLREQLGLAEPTPARRIQTVLDLVPLEPRGYPVDAAPGFGFALQTFKPFSGEYIVPGSAFSASSRAFHGDCGLAPIVKATWRLIWNPLGHADWGAQLSHAAAGPSDEQVVDVFTGRADRAPLHTWKDVTLQVQAMQALGQERYLLHKMRGQPLVFGSILELVWEV